jgi:hypothetical protein
VLWLGPVKALHRARRGVRLRRAAAGTGSAVVGGMRAVAMILLVVCGGCVLRVSDVETECEAGCVAGETCVAGECVAAAEAAADAGTTPPTADAAAEVADGAPVAVQSCDEEFGAATGYVLCAEEPASCTFFAQTAGGTCADQCALFDSECVGGYDSNAEAPCTSVAEDGCLVAHSTQTCICARSSAGL